MGNWAPGIYIACYSCAWVSKFMDTNVWSQLCLHFLKIQIPELVLLCLSLHAWRTKWFTLDNTQSVSDDNPLHLSVSCFSLWQMTFFHWWVMTAHSQQAIWVSLFFHRLEGVHCFYQNTTIGGGGSDVPPSCIWARCMSLVQYRLEMRGWRHPCSLLLELSRLAKVRTQRQRQQARLC